MGYLRVAFACETSVAPRGHVTRSGVPATAWMARCNGLMSIRTGAMSGDSGSAQIADDARQMTEGRCQFTETRCPFSSVHREIPRPRVSSQTVGVSLQAADGT